MSKFNLFGIVLRNPLRPSASRNDKTKIDEQAVSELNVALAAVGELQLVVAIARRYTSRFSVP